jgi:hypothetical protein
MKVATLFLAVFTTTLGLNLAHAATCTNASANGTFAFQLTASNGAGGVGAGIGQIAFNGSGNVSGTTNPFITYTPSGGWKADSPSTFTGTYSVSSNCTGTVTTIDTSDNTNHYFFVVDNVKKGAQYIETDDDSSVNSGFLVAEGKVTCGLGTAKRTFAANLTGLKVGTGAVGYVGQLILDDKGNVTGTMTVSIDGTVTTDAAVTGTYTEASNCTGTAAVKPAGFGTLNFDFVVANAGKELLMVETDSDTVVSGNAQE